MNLNIEAVPFSQWLAQAATVAFMMAGFNTYDMHLWYQAFIVKRKAALIYRVALILIPVSIGLAMVYIGYVGTVESIGMVNIGLFVITMPLFDERISWLEYAIRATIVALVWLVPHAGVLSEPLPLFSGAIVLCLIGFIGRNPGKFRYHPILMVLVTATFGASFWLTVPWTTIGIAMDFHLLWQSMLMYVLVGVYVALHWTITHPTYQRQIRAAKLEADDHETNNQDYDHNQAHTDWLMQQSKQNHKPMMVAALDVDNFSVVNRERGHLAGNETLIEITDQLELVIDRTRLKPRPYIYRDSGEEFSLIFPDTEPEAAMKVVKQCLLVVRNHQFVVANQVIHVTISAGLAELSADDTTIDDLLKRADDNLRLSKKYGRDTLTYEGQSSSVETESEPLTYFAQPVIDVTDNSGTSSTSVEE